MIYKLVISDYLYRYLHGHFIVNTENMIRKLSKNEANNKIITRGNWERIYVSTRDRSRRHDSKNIPMFMCLNSPVFYLSES